MLQKFDPDTATTPATQCTKEKQPSDPSRAAAKGVQLRRIVFKLELRADALLEPRQPYQLIVGAEKSPQVSAAPTQQPWVTIIGAADKPLKSHASWLNKLVQNIEQSDSEPKLALLAAPSPALLERATVAWLTPREHEMLHYRHQGLTAKETAALVGLSHRTVEKQIELARNKLGAAKLSPKFLNALFNTYRLIENYLSRHPPAVAKAYWQ